MYNANADKSISSVATEACSKSTFSSFLCSSSSLSKSCRYSCYDIPKLAQMEINNSNEQKKILPGRSPGGPFSQDVNISHQPLPDPELFATDYLPEEGR